MAESDDRVGSLLQRARRDPQAVGLLFERYRSFLKFMALGSLGTRLSKRLDASDIVQQTFAEAFRAFSRFTGSTESAFSAWIKQIHDHNLADAVRKHVGTEKQSVRQEQTFGAPDGSASFCWREPAADQSTPSQRLIRGEKALRLADLIEALPEMQCEAIRLRYLEGWPVEKISRRLDRSVTATAGLLKRGLQALRDKMSEESWS